MPRTPLIPLLLPQFRTMPSRSEAAMVRFQMYALRGRLARLFSHGSCCSGRPQ